MTIASSTSKFQYNYDGASTNFVFANTVFAEADIRVVSTDANGADTDLVLNVDYTVSITPGFDQATITYAAASGFSTGHITLLRAEPFTQGIDYQSGDRFPAQTHERGLDRSVVRDQSLAETTGRCLKFSAGTTTDPGDDIPNPVANGVLMRNSDNDGYEWGDPGDAGFAVPGDNTVNYAKLTFDTSTVVDTRANLIAAGYGPGRRITTMGFATVGDGGGADYFIQTAATYGGTPSEKRDHTISNGNVAVLIPSGAIPVRALGATSDDIAGLRTVTANDGEAVSTDGGAEVWTVHTGTPTDDGAHVIAMTGGVYAKLRDAEAKFYPAAENWGGRPEWDYIGDPEYIELAGASIREHDIFWHSGLRAYYMIADVIYTTNPNHPNTYESDIHLWKCTDPERFSGWTHLGIAIQHGTAVVGKGQYGVASCSGVAVMPDGTVLAPFSSRDSADFQTRSIGLAVSPTNPEILPWAIRDTPISNTAGQDDDPTIRKDGDTYHLWHRSAVGGAYVIVHAVSNDPVSGGWQQLPDANNIVQFPTTLAQELTHISQVNGTWNMVCMEQISGVGLRDSNAHWVSPSPYGPFEPAASFKRHLPPAAFGAVKDDIIYAGHIGLIEQYGELRGASFTVKTAGWAVDGDPYRIAVLRRPRKFTSGFRVRKNGVQNVPRITTTTILYDLEDDYDFNGDYDSTTGQFTAPVDGWYAFRASIKLNTLASTYNLSMEFAKNGTRVSGGQLLSPTPSNGIAVSAHTGRLYLEEGDTMEVRVFHDSAIATEATSTDPTWQEFTGERL